MTHGIYTIVYEPKFQTWHTYFRRKDDGYTLNKVFHIKGSTTGDTHWDEHYYTHLNSDGPIPAFTQGANMIISEIK